MGLFNPTSVTVPSSVSATATQTPITAAVTNVILLAANTNRKGSTVYNNSTARLYVALGVVATTTAFSVLLEAGGYYESPFGYTGTINGIWAAANGNALVTEMT